jgi:hypothetical protein
VKRAPKAGILLVKAEPRLTRRQANELQRKLRRSVWAQSDDGIIPLLLFGRRSALEQAADYVLRYRDECERAGRIYRRKDAISVAAKRCGLKEGRFANWLNRSKRARGG